jgi:hypothetical protein
MRPIPEWPLDSIAISFTKKESYNSFLSGTGSSLCYQLQEYPPEQSSPAGLASLTLGQKTNRIFGIKIE